MGTKGAEAAMNRGLGYAFKFNFLLKISMDYTPHPAGLPPERTLQMYSTSKSSE